MFLAMFLLFRLIQPRCSYKIRSKQTKKCGSNGKLRQKKKGQIAEQILFPCSLLPKRSRHINWITDRRVRDKERKRQRD